MKRQSFLFLSFLIVAASAMVGCDKGTSSGSISSESETSSSSSSEEVSDEDLPTPYTDSFSLNADFTGKDFIEDHVGEVTLRSCTDGDTANFLVGAVAIKLRFLGINTPESTAAIEPWGKKASNFTKEKLESAVSIVLINDPTVFGLMDSSGNRYLGFVWYQPSVGAAYRLLNLELVEQCYTRNLLYSDSAICNYRSVFVDAGVAAQATGRRVYGQADPGYDYTNTIVEGVTLRDIREKYDNYGVTEGGSSGLQLHIRALVVGMIGDNMVLRDIENPYEDGTYAGMYCFSGYSTGLASKVTVGCLVYFYCRATMFNGNIQLSDLKAKSFGDYAFKIEMKPTDSGYAYDYSPIVVDASAFADSTGFAAYNGYYIATEVTIRNTNLTDVDDSGNPVTTETYFKKDDNNNMTIYARVNADVVLNLRVDGSMSPYVSETLFTVGHTYHVEGYLVPYYNNYQIQLFNNKAQYDYIFEV